MGYIYHFYRQGSDVVADGDFFEINSKSFKKAHTALADIGNTFQENVFDHHNNLDKNIVKERQKSAASLVYRHPNNLNVTPDDQGLINIITHYLPDMDAIVASYFIKELIAGRKLGLSHRALQHIASLNDQGYVMRNKDKLSPLLIVRTFDVVYEKKFKNQSTISKSEYMLTEGFKFCECIVSYCNSYGVDSFSINSVPEDLEKELRQLFPFAFKVMDDDEIKFRESNVAHETFTIRLPDAKFPNEYKTVNGIFLKDHLDCIFLKEYYRNAGYDFTLLPQELFKRRDDADLIEGISHYRMIISVKPESGVSLEGLCRTLEEMERKKELSIADTRKIFSIVRQDGIRQGYEDFKWSETDDPWYNGADKGYSILDVPRRNSLLTYEEIWNCVLQTFSVVLSHAKLHLYIPFQYGEKGHSIQKKFDDLINDFSENKDYQLQKGNQILNLTEDTNEGINPFVRYINDYYFCDETDPSERTLHYKYKKSKLKMTIRLKGSSSDVLHDDGPNINDITFQQYEADKGSNNMEVDCENQFNAVVITYSFTVTFFSYGIGYLELNDEEMSYDRTMTLARLLEIQNLVRQHKNSEKIKSNLLSKLPQSIITKSADEKDVIKLQDVHMFPVALMKSSFSRFSMDEMLYKLSNSILWSHSYKNIGFALEQHNTRFNYHDINYYESNKIGSAVIFRPSEVNSDKIMFSEESLHNFSQIVYHIHLLALHQRHALMYFSELLATHTNPRTLKDRRKMKQRISLLRRSFIDFTAQGYFSQITPHTRFAAIYKQLLNNFDIKILYEEVEKQIMTIDDYFRSEFENYIQMISYFGIPFVIMTSLAGANVFFVKSFYHVEGDQLVFVSLGIGGLIILYKWISDLVKR